MQSAFFVIQNFVSSSLEALTEFLGVLANPCVQVLRESYIDDLAVRLADWNAVLVAICNVEVNGIAEVGRELRNVPALVHNERLAVESEHLAV